MVLIAVSHAVFSADRVTVSLESGNGYFSNQQSSLKFSVQGIQQWVGSVQWTLYVGNRAINKGEKSLTLDSDNNNEFDILIAVPPVKDNLVLKAVLKIKLVNQNASDSIAFSNPLLIFGPDPFRHQQDWIRQANIQLYDPSGNTAEILTGSKVPFNRIRSLDIDRLDRNGFVMIGSSTSLSKRQGESLLRLVESGITVVCLAPAKGSFPLSFHHESRNRPVLMRFNDESIIKELNPALDSAGWGREQNVVSSSLHLSGNKLGSVANIQTDNHGWPWLEIEFSTSRAKLIFAGFSIVPNWNTSPTPRYLLESILHYAKDDSQLL